MQFDLSDPNELRIMVFFFGHGQDLTISFEVETEGDTVILLQHLEVEGQPDLRKTKVLSKKKISSGVIRETYRNLLKELVPLLFEQIYRLQPMTGEFALAQIHAPCPN